MVRQITMPKLGAEMTVGRIVEWKKTQGEWVEKGEIVVVIETDKITYEVESSDTGYLLILRYVDEQVSIADPIGLLCDSKEELEGLTEKQARFESTNRAGLAATAAQPSEKKTEVSISPSFLTQHPRQEIKISPLARRLAQEHGLDISMVEGTGPGGRIKEEDIRRVMEKRQLASALPIVKDRAAADQPPPAKTLKEVLPIRGMRKIIAERLYASLQQMAQFTEMGEIDVTETVKYRQSLQRQEDLTGTQISYNAILVKVTALLLKEFPIMNSSIVDDGIHLWNEINIGMAVSLEDGLIVPVIRQADSKSLVEIQHLLHDFIQRAHHHRLRPDEITGGTFTISNFGSYGAFFGTPIINPPEVALLGVGVIRQVPSVVDNEVVVRWSMSYALTMDHRIIDGATGGKFIGRMRQILADPNLMGVLCSEMSTDR